MLLILQFASIPPIPTELLIFLGGIIVGALSYLIRENARRPKLRIEIERDEQSGDLFYKAVVTNKAGIFGRLVRRETAKECTPKIELAGWGGLNYIDVPEGRINMDRKSCWTTGEVEENISPNDKEEFHVLRWDGNHDGEVLFPFETGYEEDTDQTILHISEDGPVGERRVRTFREIDNWEIKEIRVAPDNMAAERYEIIEFPWENDRDMIEINRVSFLTRLKKFFFH